MFGTVRAAERCGDTMWHTRQVAAPGIDLQTNNRQHVGRFTPQSGTAGAVLTACQHQPPAGKLSIVWAVLFATAFYLLICV